MRTFVFIAILLSQPTSALAGMWQPGMPGHIAPAAESHCEGATHKAMQTDTGHGGQHQTVADQPSESAETDCATTCNHCASCAAIAMTAPAMAHVLATSSIHSELRINVPVGTCESLYRPPILT